MPKQEKIRLLIADDSFFMKKMLKEMVEQENNIEVVGMAKNGKEAVEMALSLKPDVITMDYNMPVLDGAKAIAEIMSKSKEKKPGIIMLSAYAAKDAQEAIGCLQAGAVELVAKPSGELSLDIDKIQTELIDKIYLAAKANVQVMGGVNKEKIRPCKTRGVIKKVVVIGSSTGGPPIVEYILSSLPSDIDATIFIAQHMPQYFIDKFAQRIDKLSPLKIKVAQNGDLVRAGTVYLTPAEKKIKLEGNIINIEKEEKKLSPQPSIDNLMTEAAKTYKEKVIGIVLTGMGEDGTVGLDKIKEKGGFTLVQEPKTAVIDSMPKSAIKAVHIDRIVDPLKIPEEILKLLL